MDGRKREDRSLNDVELARKRILERYLERRTTCCGAFTTIVEGVECCKACFVAAPTEAS